MNLKTTLIALLGFCLIMNIEAKPVSLTEAEKVAKNFVFITLNTYENGCSYEQIRLNDPYTYLVNDAPVFYAFQMEPGFIIISAEDAFTPVLGYSFEGRFIFDDAPASYKGFILNYVEQISYVRANQFESSPEVAEAWAELRNDEITAFTISRERDVAPLLYCHWDQGSPYNILCPEDPAGPGGHTWVGCVATAMAQIMYYWRYPEVGTGQHCYIPGHYSYGQQCANFGETYYNWTGMINGIDNRFPDANAELQYHCAVSVNMNFSPDGSGAQSSNVPGSLNQYFRYNTAQYKEKEDYSQAGWISLLKADIDVGKPLYYSGYNSNYLGHAFVCDGYQGENFHFNFGWSGSGNGYYSLYDVGSFNQGQACVRNFVPSEGAYPYHNTGTINITSRSGSITDGSGPVENYLDNNTAYWSIDPQTIYDSISSITLTFSAFDLTAGDSVKVFDGGTTSDALLGAYSGTTLPPALTSTGNKMLIEFKTDGSGNAAGWYAEYNTVSPTWCQGLTQFTEPTATFSDGSGDFYYQGGTTCLWKINPLYADKITLSFNYFETEEGVDKVKVYDGQTQIAELSGTDIPGSIEATSGTMFITWSTSLSNNFQGWEAYYEVNNVGIQE
ncbi:MAG: C10 family peptidase, partial [Bacteroidales bacterium]